ncbi:MAG: hypothetical protein F4Y03_00400 [Alphaproteobacteria bacterium]|nr:hypothetical protein [Alphaproteobacteria bacterium]
MTRQLSTERSAHQLDESNQTLGAVRSWPNSKARLWTMDAVALAGQDAAILAIVASGSAVRDVSQSDDLDLVLVYRTRRPSLSRPPIGVDLQQHEADEVPRKLAKGHDFLSWAVRFGQPLFEREQWWSRLRADWSGRLSLPSAAEARKRAKRAQQLHQEMQLLGDHDAATENYVSMLTHLARATLSDAGVLPRSRPELADQLRQIGEAPLAERLADALAHRYS